LLLACSEEQAQVFVFDVAALHLKTNWCKHSVDHFHDLMKESQRESLAPAQ